MPACHRLEGLPENKFDCLPAGRGEPIRFSVAADDGFPFGKPPFIGGALDVTRPRQKASRDFNGFIDARGQCRDRTGVM